MSEIIYFKNKPPDDVSWLREAIMEMEMRDAALQIYDHGTVCSAYRLEPLPSGGW